jgi:hypothetical protein
MSKRFCCADVPRITVHLRLPAFRYSALPHTLGHRLGDSAPSRLTQRRPALFPCCGTE